ncbi:MAG TPA: hypothetical protein VLY24_06490 [Bryobacteraceae bacterium]|nr:hypothetical protein [Bryobacteraceae bacterium]
MPLPPYLISANVFLCERILNETDGVVSAIRIVDLFYVTDLPSEAPPGAMPIVQAWGLVILKSHVGYQGSHTVEIKLINVRGESQSLGPEQKVQFVAKHPDVAGGVTLSVQLNIGVKNLGTCYLCAVLDGEEIARAPFTLMRQVSKTNIG